MFGLFKSKAREARHLNRDAPLIIDTARQSYRSDLVRDIAALTQRHVDEAKTQCAGDSACMKRAVAHFRALHLEARRKNEHLELTAYTLIVIYLRAELAGDAGAPARVAIDAFLDEWRHALEGDQAPPP